MRGLVAACVLGVTLACSLGACGKSSSKPTVPPDPASTIGTWTGAGITVIVASDYTWRGTRHMSWACGGGTCSYDIQVSGTVQPGAQYSLSADRRDSYGNLSSISGSWSADFKTLSANASCATRNGGESVSGTLTKVGSAMEP